MSAAGVPGIGGNGWAKPSTGSPDEAAGYSYDDGSCRLIVGVDVFRSDERRRRWDAVKTCEGDRGARM